MKSLKEMVGKKIKLRREELGYATQTALGLAMNIDPAQISRWESGVNEPGPEILPQLCAALKIDETYFADPVPEARPITAKALFEYVRGLEKEVQRLRGLAFGYEFEIAKALREKNLALLEKYRPPSSK